MENLNSFPESFFSEPVDHVLIRAGLCTDRTFMTFIKNHEVSVKKVSGLDPVKDRKVFVDSGKDEIFIDGEKALFPDHLYLILNKPVDVVCSKVSDSHKTVFDFIPDQIKTHPLYNHLHIAGRLDADSRGLVLLTTNGKFSSSLIQPETHVEKTYEVRLEQKVNPELQEKYIKAFAEGMDLPPEKKGEAFRTQSAHLEFCERGDRPREKGDRPHCKVTLQEGKFRQIRRMFHLLGNRVTDLKRISMGALKLPSELSEGQVLELFRNADLPK